VRGLSTQETGAAEFGECMETARRIRRNDLESWTREWTRTADRVAAAAEHGWNCLIFEGPGQWGALKRNPGLVFRPDDEKPVGAAIDYLETRPDVDTDRLAIIGYSMGGYLAPRGALDPRIKACVPNSLVVDCGAAARAGMEGLVKSQKLMDFSFRVARKLLVPVQWGFQHSQWTLGIRTAQDWIDVYEPYTLVGLEGRYRNPMLFLFGEDDIRDAAAPSAEIVRGLLDFILSLDCPRSVRLFTAEEGASSHCQIGGLSYARATVFSWLDHVLLGGPEPTSADPRAGERFVEAFGRYGGRRRRPGPPRCSGSRPCTEQRRHPDPVEVVVSMTSGCRGTVAAVVNDPELLGEPAARADPGIARELAGQV